jgi:drug/metabolite transporter (DMT)-like permease
LISSVAQIILKKSAGKKYDSVIKEYLNIRVIGAYSIFFMSTLLTMYAYKGVPLTLGTLLEAAGYIYIPVLSFLILKEKITPRMVIGSLFIICGIIVYNL